MNRTECTLDDVRAALGYISPDCEREFWVHMGMAIKSEFGSQGFDAWDGWSAQGGSYKAADAKSVWKSIKSSGAGRSIGIGTLFNAAMTAGYKPDKKELTAEDKARLAADAEKRRLKREKEAAREAAQHEKKVAQVKERARTIWASLPDAGSSGYLTRKKIKAWGIRFSRGSIVIPVRRPSGDLVGLQFIPEIGDKKFLTGTQKQGSWHMIGQPSPKKKPGKNPRAPLGVAEGYATAASIHQATGWPCAVAFDSGNLKPVCIALANKYPHYDLIVCGDDDPQTPGNPGRTKATAAAKAVGARVCFPHFGGNEQGKGA